MNSHCFVFFLNGKGHWIMEADRIFNGEVTEQQVIAEWQDGMEEPDKNRDKHRVFVIPTAEEPTDTWWSGRHE